MKIIGKPFSPGEFDAYFRSLAWVGKFKPELIVIHHTASPSLAMRPKGWTDVHMQNLKSYYGTDLGWSAGPHIFIDEDQAWVFSPLTERGVHAVSFNRNGIGIEMLGNFDSEDPWSGRGLQVLRTTAHVVRSLMAVLKLDKNAIRFHREDPKTAKTCPGRLLSKERFLALI